MHTHVDHKPATDLISSWRLLEFITKSQESSVAVLETANVYIYSPIKPDPSLHQ